MRTTLLCLAMMLALGPVGADTLARYTFDTERLDSSDTEPRTVAGPLTLPSGMRPVVYSKVALGSRSALLSNTGFYATNKQTALSVRDYVSITVDVDPGYAVRFDRIELYIRRATGEGDGAPDHFAIYTSADDFDEAIEEREIPAQADAEFVKYTIDLRRVPELQSRTEPTEFRIVMWASQGIATPKQRVLRLDNIEVTGQVRPAE